MINWTLSESLRRVELPVGVAYGSDVKLVSRLLEQAATAHESVLTSPAPAVFFKEFADSSLNFELQFWVMQESNATKVKSEVALCAMDLLDKAGIEIPFPQRDLRLRAVDPVAAALLAPNGAQGSSRWRRRRSAAAEPGRRTSREPGRQGRGNDFAGVQFVSRGYRLHFPHRCALVSASNGAVRVSAQSADHAGE